MGGLDLSIYLRGSLNFHTLCELQSKFLESLLCLRLSYLTFGTDFGSLLAPSSHPGLSCCGSPPRSLQLLKA